MILACMGDSLTEGYEIDPKRRWTEIVASTLSLTVINSGISGDTTNGMLSRFHRMVIAQSPSHCIIMGGTNDLADNLPDDLIISNIRAMTRHARHNTIATIIGIPTPVFHGMETAVAIPDAWLQEFSSRVDVFRDKLKEWAINDGQPVIDFGHGITPQLYLDDGVHPNEGGHVLMAQNAIEVLKELIEKGRL